MTFLTSAYGQSVDRRLTIESEQREIFGNFLGEVERCARLSQDDVVAFQRDSAPLAEALGVPLDSTDPEVVDDAIDALESLLGASGRLNAACETALYSAEAKIYLITDLEMSNLASELASATAFYRQWQYNELMYRVVTVAFDVPDSEQLDAVFESSNETLQDYRTEYERTRSNFRIEAALDIQYEDPGPWGVFTVGLFWQWFVSTTATMLVVVLLVLVGTIALSRFRRKVGSA